MQETHYEAALNALQHITSRLEGYVLDARSVAFALTGARQARATAPASRSAIQSRCGRRLFCVRVAPA
jgi:hypothetical protein